MSAEHRRPLVAFVLVAIGCALIVGLGLRPQSILDMIIGPSASRVRIAQDVVIQPGAHTVPDGAPEQPPAPEADQGDGDALAGADQTRTPERQPGESGSRLPATGAGQSGNHQSGNHQSGTGSTSRASAPTSAAPSWSCRARWRRGSRRPG